MCARYTRALSPRNLVSGCECGRAFTAGVGSGSPSRDAANWLSSRCSPSVETSRRYDWLRTVFPRCAPLPSFNLAPLERCGGTREARSTVAESLVAALSGGYDTDTVPDSARLEGSSIVDEPGEG